MSGTYAYPDVPKDVFRRHQRCRCTIEYDPGDGRGQNVHTNRWTDSEKESKIEARKQFTGGERIKKEVFLQERLDFLDPLTNEKSFIPKDSVVVRSKTIAQGKKVRIAGALTNKYGGRVTRWKAQSMYTMYTGTKIEGNSIEQKLSIGEKKMKTIDVYQCEYDRSFPLPYVGKVQYVGESFGPEGLTDGKTYDVVFDKYGDVKIVDDSEEDYIYNLANPKPLDGSSRGGKFFIEDDPDGFLAKAGLKHNIEGMVL